LRSSKRVSLANREADTLLAEALARLPQQGDPGGVRSIPIPAAIDRSPLILHLVPVRLAAHGVFAGISAIFAVTPVVPTYSMVGNAFL